MPGEKPREQKIPEKSGDWRPEHRREEGTGRERQEPQKEQRRPEEKARQP